MLTELWADCECVASSWCPQKETKPQRDLLSRSRCLPSGYGLAAGSFLRPGAALPPRGSGQWCGTPACSLSVRETRCLAHGRRVSLMMACCWGTAAKAHRPSARPLLATWDVGGSKLGIGFISLISGDGDCKVALEGRQAGGEEECGLAARGFARLVAAAGPFPDLIYDRASQRIQLRFPPPSRLAPCMCTTAPLLLVFF